MSVSFKYFNDTLQDSYLSKMVHWLIVASSLVLFLYSVNTPRQNWDMLGYAGSAVSMENSDAGYIHNYIYQDLKAYATDKEFKELTAKNNYRKAMYQDKDAFNQQIPFYKIRIIFAFLILGLAKLGFNVFIASHILSAILVSSGFLIYYHAYKKLIHPVFWLSYPLFFISFNATSVAQSVTADSLAFFWIGLVCFSFNNAHWKTFFLLLITSILARTELIFLVAIFSSYFIVFRPDLRIIAAACILVSLVLYLLINNFVGNYGWGTVFNYVFLSGMEATHPAQYSSADVSIRQYMSVVFTNMRLFISDRYVVLFEIITLLQFTIFWLLKKNDCSISRIFLDIMKNTTLTLTLLSFVYLLLHYIIFPTLDSRFFISQYVISTLGFLSLITSLMQKIDVDFIINNKY